MGSFTVALLEALLSVGIPPDRARKVVDQFDRAIDERYSLHAQVLATKRDVAEVHAALARDIAKVEIGIADVRSTLARDIAKVETGVAELRAGTARDIAALDTRLTGELARARVDLVKWTLSALTAQTALLLGAMKLL